MSGAVLPRQGFCTVLAENGDCDDPVMHPWPMVDEGNLWTESSFDALVSMRISDVWAVDPKILCAAGTLDEWEILGSVASLLREYALL